MPKIKTHKSASKRFKRTGSGKLIQRRAGQDHFNARERGKDRTNKRRNKTLSKVNQKNIKKLIGA